MEISDTTPLTMPTSDELDYELDAGEVQTTNVDGAVADVNNKVRFYAVFGFFDQQSSR